MSRVPVAKRYFTVFSTVENRMCKRSYRATFFCMRAIFIQAVPEVLGSVNRPYVVVKAFDSVNHAGTETKILERFCNERPFYRVKSFFKIKK